MNAPISFYDNTPKEVIMRRFNGNIHSIRGLIGKVHHCSWEFFRISTTLMFLFKMNPVCALGVIPFTYICYTTMSGSNKAFKEMCRCMDAIHSKGSINQGEIMSGGTTIRAVGAQDYAKKVNEQGGDSWVLG